MIKTNRGYSLIEIGVGILVLTIFLIFSISVFNACYNNYRRIKVRNIATDRAVYHIEQMLQTDSDELAGYFIKDSQNTRIPNPVFEQFVYDHFNAFKSRYASFRGVSLDEVSTPSVGSESLRSYIEKDKSHLINAFIRMEAYPEATDEQLEEGTYGFLDEAGLLDKKEIVLNNEMAYDATDSYDYIVSNNGALKVVKTITRIPSVNGKAFGNNVLILRVDVYYTREFNRNMTEADMEKITIETVKAAK